MIDPEIVAPSARCRSSDVDPARTYIRREAQRGKRARGGCLVLVNLGYVSFASRNSALMISRRNRSAQPVIWPYRRPRPVALSSSTYADRSACINPAIRGRALPASRERSVKSCGKRAGITRTRSARTRAKRGRNCAGLITRLVVPLRLPDNRVFPYLYHAH